MSKRELETCEGEPSAKRACGAEDDEVPMLHGFIDTTRDEVDEHGFRVTLTNPSVLKDAIECMYSSVSITIENGRLVLYSASEGGSATSRFVLNGDGATLEGDNVAYSVNKVALKSAIASCTKMMKKVDGASAVIKLNNGVLSVSTNGTDVQYENVLEYADPPHPAPETDKPVIALEVTREKFDACLDITCARADAERVTLELSKNLLSFTCDTANDRTTSAMSVRNPTVYTGGILDARMVKTVKKMKSTMIEIAFTETYIIFTADTGDGLIQMSVVTFEDKQHEFMLDA